MAGIDEMMSTLEKQFERNPEGFRGAVPDSKVDEALKRKKKQNSKPKNKKIKELSDNDLTYQIHLAKADKQKQRLDNLFNEKQRRSRMKKPLKERSLLRSQNAINSMFSFWQNKKNSHLPDRNKKMNYYAKLSWEQNRKGRKLTRSERERLYEKSSPYLGKKNKK